MPEETEIQPEETVGEQPKVDFFDKLKTHKLKILAGVLGVLVFTGAVFGAYKLGQKQVQPGPQPTPTPGLVATPTPDPTANWEVYEDGKYNFTFKHPLEWQITEAEVSGTGTIIPLHQLNIIAPDAGLGRIMVFLANPESGLENPLDTGKLKAEFGEGTSWEIKQIGEKDALAIYRLAPEVQTIVRLRLNSEYALVIEQPMGSDDTTFNLMLSTFKFLPSAGSGQGE